LNLSISIAIHASDERVSWISGNRNCTCLQDNPNLGLLHPWQLESILLS
jgi:hypothetical protein